MVDVNDAPVAINDNFQTTENTALTGDVTANDFDEDSDSLTTALTTAPNNAASFTLNADGSFSYVPNAGFFGLDTFEYSVSDGNGGTDTATVTITVAPVNELPIPESDTFEIIPGQSNASVVSVLANDVDVDGDALVAVLVGAPTNGSLTLDADGTFVYTPNSGFTGDDSFTYVASDGSGESVATTVVLQTSATAIPPSVTPVPVITPVESAVPTEMDDDEQDDSDNDAEQDFEPEVVLGQNTGPISKADDRPGTIEEAEDDGFQSEVNLASEIMQVMGDQREAQLALQTILARFSGTSLTREASELDQIINSSHLLFAFNAQYLWEQIDNQIESTSFDTFNVTVGAVSAVGTLGFVLWTLRGGALMAVALSQIPSWGMIDPLPVLDSYSSGRVKKSDDEFGNYF